MGMYPGIERAALEIAYANGGINRDRSKTKALAELRHFLSRSDLARDQLSNISDWLLHLSDADLDTVCDGEEREADAILRGSPIFTQSLLNGIFDDVC